MSRLAAHADAAAVGVGDSFDKIQPQARAVNLRCAGFAAAPERVEDVFQIVSLNAESAVTDGDTNLSLFTADSDCRLYADPTALAGIFHRIVDQVAQRARKRRDVGHHRRQIGRNLLLDLKATFSEQRL